MFVKWIGHSIISVVHSNPNRFTKEFETEFGIPTNVVYLYRTDAIKIQCKDMEQRCDLLDATSCQGKPIDATLRYTAQKLERQEEHENENAQRDWNRQMKQTNNRD